jgi:hypothetical protein
MSTDSLENSIYLWREYIRTKRKLLRPGFYALRHVAIISTTYAHMYVYVHKRVINFDDKCIHSNSGDLHTYTTLQYVKFDTFSD